MTGHISPFYELLRVTQQFLVSSGVTEESSKSYVAAFYSSLAQGAEVSPESFAALCEEAATPGGLNEQVEQLLRNILMISSVCSCVLSAPHNSGWKNSRLFCCNGVGISFECVVEIFAECSTHELLSTSIREHYFNFLPCGVGFRIYEKL